MSEIEGWLGAHRALFGWLQAAHPFPLAMVVCLTALIGVASADGEPPLRPLTIALAAMLLSQLAIGWTNDYVDRANDALHQPSKPVPTGSVDARRLPMAAAIACIASIAFAATLGLPALGFFVAGTTAGLAYDVYFKDTRLSWLPYAVAFAVLPPFVWSALDVFRDGFLWLYAVATPLIPAVHVANTLPDIESDRAAGRNGIVVRIGRDATLRLLAVCLAAPVALLLLSLLWIEYDTTVLALMLAVYAFLLLPAAQAYRRRPFRAGASIAFRLVVAAGIVFTTGWLTAV